MKLSRLGLACVAAGAAFLAACTPPKYVHYWSVWRDWHAQVPWGWNIRTEQEGTHYARTDLTGPTAPEFYRGVPSISVRWYEYKTPHRLPDGLLEAFTDSDEYIVQTLKTVYGPHCADFWDERTPRTSGAVPQDDQGLGQPCALVEKKNKQIVARGRPESIYLGDGRKAKHFTVLSPVAVEWGTKAGTAIDPKTRKSYVARMHEYAVVPLEKGFYVIIYPATRDGYDLFKPEFNNFLNTFQIRAEGPGGAAAAPSSSGAGAPAAPVASGKPSR